MFLLLNSVKCLSPFFSHQYLQAISLKEKLTFNHPDLVKGVRNVLAVLGGAYQALTALQSVAVDVKG